MRWQWCEEPEPGAPQANMDRDLALFEALRDGRLLSPIVRVYRWDRPAVSVGRLQPEDPVRAAFPGLPLVRRPTGGRAVLHGGDLTFSVVCRAAWLPQAGGVLASFRQIVQGLIDAFCALGVPAALGQVAPPQDRQAPPVDCFATIARCDVADSRRGVKLVGSAQRRERGVVLQQMTVPRSCLPGEAAFLACARSCLGAALGVEAWVEVDSANTLCYTEGERTPVCSEETEHGAQNIDVR